jgi:alcohol dehydrogenase
LVRDYFEFRSATKILSGRNALAHLPYELANLGVTAPLMITDRRIRSLGLTDIVLASLADSTLEDPVVFDDVPVDSSIETANAVARLYAEHSCDGIVAVGGGSVLDTAKGACMVLGTGARDLMEHRGSEVLSNTALPPLVAVPTTAGTGSEVTGVAVVRDDRRDVKMAFVSFDLQPQVAVLDPRMTLGLPPRVTASTAMDALVHAVEAASCKQRNPLSDVYAYAAIAGVRAHLPVVLADGKNAAARLAMANAALMAGVAFSNSMVGVVHALGHACGGVAHVAHGEAMAILLPYCMEFNLEAACDAYAELLLPLAGPEVYASTPAPRRAEAAIAAARALQHMCAELAGLPTRLSEVGVTREQFAEIARGGLDDGSIAFNPRAVSLDDAVSILEAAL